MAGMAKLGNPRRLSNNAARLKPSGARRAASGTRREVPKKCRSRAVVCHGDAQNCDGLVTAPTSMRARNSPFCGRIGHLKRTVPSKACPLIYNDNKDLYRICIP